jgi:FMN phosphatase YigB (HAD superfamily)
VVSRGPFRALSLDLWFTTIYHDAETDDYWRQARSNALDQIFRTRAGERLDRAGVETALETVHLRLAQRGLNPGLIDPAALLTEYGEELGADFALPLDRAGHLYSSAGLAEHPPLVNPELAEVVRTLEARRIPLIAITNTARRGVTWQEFFRGRAGVRFEHIVASCEVGRAKPDPEIFVEAARRLGMAPSAILHVGDRWELDVDGALRAGCGAALYRGLWDRYPPGMYPVTDPSLLRHPSVPTLDRLDEVVNSDLHGRLD